ncbi:MAG: hypothetical protein ACBZ72_04910 [Candidatus Bathyarchaeia archaeon]
MCVGYQEPSVIEEKGEGFENGKLYSGYGAPSTSITLHATSQDLRD